MQVESFLKVQIQGKTLQVRGSLSLCIIRRRLELQVSGEKEGRGLEVNTTLVSLLRFCPTIQPVSA